MSRTLLLLAAALSAAALLLAEPARCSAAPPSAAEKKIEEALAKPTQVEFIETPLNDVIDFLRDFHKIEIQVDRKAFNDAGLDASTLPVTTNLKGISLRSALNLVLRNLDLTYLVEDEVLLITTPAAAARRLTTKVYRVADLVAADDPQQQAQNRDVLIHVIAATVAPESWAGGPAAFGGAMGGMGMMGMGGMGGMGMGGMGGAGMGGGMPGGMDGPGMPGPGRGGYGPPGAYGPSGYDGPAYAGAGGPPRKQAPEGTKGSIAGAAFGGVPILVVSQTYDVHCQVAALLEELRTVACAKQPTAPKEEKASAAPAAKPARDPFGARPSAKPPAKGSPSGGDDPFGQ